MGRQLKIFAALFAGMAAIVIAGIVILSSLDFNHFRDEIQNQLEAATGRKITITGDIDIEISTSPRLRVDGIRIANAGWGSAPEMVTLDTLEAAVSLAPLFSGRVDIDYIVIDGLELLLETSRAGKANWEFSPPAAASPATGERGTGGGIDGAGALTLRDVRINNVRIRYLDGGNDSDIRVNVPRINVSSPGPGMPLDVDMHASVAGIALDMDAVVALGDNGVTVKKLDTKFGRSDFSGSVAVDVSSARPQINADIKSSVLDVSELKSIIAGKKTGAADKGDADKKAQKIFPDVPLDISGLAAVDGVFKYAAGSVNTDVLKISSLQATGTLKNGTLRLDPAGFGAGNGQVSIRAELAGRNPGARFKTDISLKKVDAGKLAGEMGLDDYLTLATNADISLKGAGASVAAIMAGLEGSIRAAGSDGRLNDKVISAVFTGVGEILPWVGKEDTNIINCLLVDIPVSKGKATARAVAMDTVAMSFRVTGHADLGKELLDLGVSSRAKNVSLGSFAVPVKVGGTLGKPSVGVDPAGAVVGTIGNAAGLIGTGVGGIGELLGSLSDSNNAKGETGENPCASIVSPKKDPAKKETAVKGDVKNDAASGDKQPIDAVKNLGKGIGSALEGIFGGKK